MTFVILNLVKLQDSMNNQQVFKSIIEPRHLEFIKKICPPKKRIFIDHVIVNIQKKFKMPREKAKKITNKMIDEEILIKDDNLDVTTNLFINSTRKVIYSHIEKNPGTYTNDIKNTLQLGTNQVLWHLAILEEYNLVNTKNIGKTKVYYTGNVVEKRIMIGFIFLKKNANLLLKFLIDFPDGINISLISTEINVSISTLRYILKKLTKLGILDYKLYKLYKNNKNYYLPDDSLKIVQAQIASKHEF